MNLQNFQRGLEILTPHYSKPDGYFIGAEHDEIYLYATDTPLTKPEIKEMLDLGWDQIDFGDLNDEGEFDVNAYNPDSSWRATF